MISPLIFTRSEEEHDVLNPFANPFANTPSPTVIDSNELKNMHPQCILAPFRVLLAFAFAH
jgi:hypothetical protein